jgi:protein SCO1
MNKKYFKYIIFFSLLLIGFLIVLSQLNGGNLLKKRHKIISTVKPFNFIDHNNQAVNNSTIDGKVVLVEYFFTNCKTICPVMNKIMQEIYAEFKNEKDFLILSHTSKPWEDSVPKLKQHAELLGAGKNWLFVTGNKAELYYHARKSYAVFNTAQKNIDESNDFDHTQLFALVNKNGEIKKQLYDSLEPSEIAQLKVDIKAALRGAL